jgi:dTDP-4-amino-4,6-dideoxygalactose transaminase
LSEWVALTKVVATNQLLRYEVGPTGYTNRFEARFAQQFGVDHVLAVNSGTNGLIAALAAAQIGPGDEVLVPAYTWMSTAVAPMSVGAVPVLVDIDETLTMDPDDILRKITPQTKAIMPVHMLNLVCDMDRIVAIAREKGLRIIEDASQAIGVRYRGRPAGTIGDLGVFSFNHHKSLSSGEGGAVITNDSLAFERVRMFSDVAVFAREAKTAFQTPVFASFNFRVSELTGALMYTQLRKLEAWIARLQWARHIFVDELQDIPGVRITPHNDPENAVGLCLTFDNADDAQRFAGHGSAIRLIDSGVHVFTNWLPVNTKTAFHEKMNAYNWSVRGLQGEPMTSDRTLDILSRSCRIIVDTRGSASRVRKRARDLRYAITG